MEYSNRGNPSTAQGFLQIPKPISTSIQDQGQSQGLSNYSSQSNYQPIKREYVNTGKRARAGNDEGLPYTNTITPYMYVPTPTITMSQLPQSFENTQTTPANPFGQQSEEYAFSPFSPQGSFSDSQNPFFGTIDTTFQTSNPMMDIFGQSTAQTSAGSSEPAFAYQEPPFEKQPIMRNSNTSMLFQENRSDRPQSSSSYRDIQDSLLAHRGMKNSDIINMSQMMLTEEPLGIVSESLFDELYGDSSWHNF